MSSYNNNIQYHLANRVDPMDRESGLKIGPVPLYRGDSSFDLICKLVSDRSLLTEADVMAILQAFITKASIYLVNSRAVQMGDFGYLTGALNTDQVPTAEEYTQSNIRQAHVVFIPSAQLRKQLVTTKMTLLTLPEQAKKEPDMPVA